MYHYLSSPSHRAAQGIDNGERGIMKEDLVEKTNNPITVTVFGNRQNENCWSGG